MKNTKIFRILALVIILSLFIMTIPVTPVLAAGTITALYPPSGPAGTGVTITGSGFAASTSFTVSFTNPITGFSQFITSGFTTATGAVSAAALIPEAPKVASTYYVQVIAGAEAATAPFTLISQIEALSKSSGYVGDQVTISKGAGFAASQAVTIYFDNVSVTTTTTNTLGSFPSVTFTVPGSAKGSHTIKAQDTPGNFATTAFTTKQLITITPTSGVGGDSITISGTGFGASRSVTITFGNTQIGTTTTDTKGSFSSSLTIPAQVTGTYTIKASDGINTDSKNFTISATTNISKTSGYIGESITISGTGFGASRSVTITFGNTQVATTTTDTKGSFSSSFAIPAHASGTYTIVASDGINTDSKNFTISATTNISKTSGYIGEEITVSGTGFSVSKPITITLGNTQIGTTTSDAKGSFSSSFAIPAHVTGTYNLKVSDGINIINLDFTVSISASLNQATGDVGTKLTVNGTGFTGTVSIKYDNAEVAQATTHEGAFSATFSVPPSAGGNHTITVSDGTNIEQFTFTMESTPPPIPQPLLPQMGTKAKATAYFDWEDVTDPSGVTYTLQIATDAAFTDILLGKDGLTASEYTLTEEEKLASTKKDAPYYWRIRSMDGASNKSQWTTAGEFEVGFQWPEMKGWLLYLLIGIGAILVFFLGLWVGKRTAYY